MEVLSPETYFLQQGILGVIIVVLGGVVLWQQRRLDRKDEEIRKLYESMGLVQEKRLADNDKHITGFLELGGKLVSADTAIQKGVDGLGTSIQLMQQRQKV